MSHLTLTKLWIKVTLLSHFKNKETITQKRYLTWLKSASSLVAEHRCKLQSPFSCWRWAGNLLVVSGGNLIWTGSNLTLIHKFVFQQSLGIDYILQLYPNSLMMQLATCMPIMALCSVFLCAGFTLRKLCSQEARWPQPPWEDLHQTKTGQEFQNKPQIESYCPLSFVISPTLSQPLGNEICQLVVSGSPAHLWRGDGFWFIWTTWTRVGKE